MTRAKRTSRLPTPPEIPNDHQFSLPTGYGHDRIIVMVKDPWWLFAYWEIQSSTERAARAQLLPAEAPGLQTVLRVYDVTGTTFPKKPAGSSFDISVSNLARNWYIPVNAPGRAFIVEIGILAKNGRFLMMARSERVSTPLSGPAKRIDPAWVVDESTFQVVSGEAPVARTSSSLKKSIHEFPSLRARGNASSSSALPPTSPAEPRAFWCRVDTELMLYGATEPRSTVYFQGQRIPIRPDGTFSLRLALPEGTHAITVEAVGPDGRQSKTLSSIVTRGTSMPTPATDAPPRNATVGESEGSRAS